MDGTTNSCQGLNMVRWRPGQEVSLAPPLWDGTTILHRLNPPKLLKLPKLFAWPGNFYGSSWSRFISELYINFWKRQHKEQRRLSCREEHLVNVICCLFHVKNVLLVFFVQATFATQPCCCTWWLGLFETENKTINFGHFRNDNKTFKDDALSSTAARWSVTWWNENNVIRSKPWKTKGKFVWISLYLEKV